MLSRDKAKIIAARTVETWDKYDRFRVVAGEGDEEPSGVTVAREFIKMNEEVEGLRQDIALAECQYLDCGGRLSPPEVVEEMRKILQDSLAGVTHPLGDKLN